MSRIKEKLDQLNRNALVCYLTPDFPIAGCTESLVLALEKSGVDIIEIGIPFSDPLADGPIVQTCSQQVLEKGITLKRILTIIKNIRKQSDIPLITMGYANSVLNRGIDQFFRQLKQAGVDGAIVPDVPMEEMDRFLPAVHAAEIDFIPLVSPLSSSDRIKTLSMKAAGFIYCVSITGVTGVRKGNYFSGELLDLLSRVKKNSMLPALVGFGISEAAHIRFLKNKCDGYIIGSALLKAISPAHTVDQSVQAALSFINGLI
jgi:tryptophan synthase alpha chain